VKENKKNKDKHQIKVKTKKAFIQFIGK